MSLKKCTYLVFGLFILPLLSTGQEARDEFRTLDSLRALEDRPSLIFIHTDWCKHCQLMKETTLSSAKIQKLLDERYYSVELDAEYEEDIAFSGQIFKFQPSGPNTGVHELAESLAKQNGKLSYPTTCILNADNEIIFQYAGFLAEEQLLGILKNLE